MPSGPEGDCPLACPSVQKQRPPFIDEMSVEIVLCFGAICFENKIKRKEHNLREGCEQESGSAVLLLLLYQQFMVSLEETESPVEMRGPGKDQLWCQEAFGKITWLRWEPWCLAPPWAPPTFQKPPRCPASSLASFQTRLPGSVVTSGALTTSSLLKLGAPPAFCLTHWLLSCTCYAVLTPLPPLRKSFLQA